MFLNLIGGFLGSGKTTAIVQGCQLLIDEGKRVGVITNDQGDQQVDTAFVKSFGISTREVANSCFCCNFQQLDEHIQSLSGCDVIFAESVGSCTDLVATIQKPMRQVRPEMEVRISVFVDASLLASLLEGSSLFIEESVRYIFRKQMEESDVLVINKNDQVTNSQRTRIASMLAAEYQSKEVRFQNSQKKKEVALWLTQLTQGMPLQQHSLALDYDQYGAGEAELAWLDQQIAISASHGNAAFVAGEIIRSIHQHIQERALTIGHLKFFVETEQWKRKVSITLTSADPVLFPEGSATSGTMLINARVQTAPHVLSQLVEEAFHKTSLLAGVILTKGKGASFQPGYPRPTHRLK